mgnify:CR=1 FL=1
MSYLVLARKYRPQTFDEVVGQDAIAQTLRNAIAADRVGHAFLFAGPRGVGKTTMARLFAKALNCEKGPTADPCGQCEICRRVPKGDDIDVIEIDGASTNSVDDVRNLRQNAGYAPAHSRFKIYIIDEVHMLSKAAFNALLKTLEEPPPHVKFIFATTEPNKLLETVRSRCQEYNFKPIGRDDMIVLLKKVCDAEGIDHEEGALEMVARRARGGMRDSLSLLDQLIGFTDGHVSVEDTRSILGVLPGQTLRDIVLCFPKGVSGQVLTMLEKVVAEGVSPEELVQGLQEFLRDVLVARSCGVDSPMLFNSPEDVKPVAESAFFNEDTVVYMLQVLAAALRDVRQGTEGRIPVEMALVKLCWVQRLAPIEELADRLLALEEKIRVGVPAGGFDGGDGGGVKKKESDVAASQPTVAPDRPLTLVDVQRHWSLVVEAMRHRKAMLATMLNDGRPSELDGDVLTVAYPESARFACENASREVNQEPISAAVAQALGKTLRVKATVDDAAFEAARPVETSEPAAPEDEPSAAESDAPTPDPLVIEGPEDIPPPPPADEDSVEAIEAIEPVAKPLNRDERRKVMEDDTVKQVIEAFQGHVVDIKRR